MPSLHADTSIPAPPSFRTADGSGVFALPPLLRVLLRAAGGPGGLEGVRKAGAAGERIEVTVVQFDPGLWQRATPHPAALDRASRRPDRETSTSRAGRSPYPPEHRPGRRQIRDTPGTLPQEVQATTAISLFATATAFMVASGSGARRKTPLADPVAREASQERDRPHAVKRISGMPTAPPLVDAGAARVRRLRRRGR